MAKCTSVLLAMAFGVVGEAADMVPGINLEPVGSWGDASIIRKGWMSAPPDGSVPAGLFLRAITSLAPHYRDDLEALEEHLREEHAIFAALEAEAETDGGGGGGGGGGGTRRAHLCCTHYHDGPTLKSALEVAAGGRGFVRTALNSNVYGGYCAIAHIASAVAAEASAADRAAPTVRCSPLTHASKEPLSLLAPSSEFSSSGRGGGNAARPSFFGLRLGPAVQDGLSRGLVVTLSPGSLPVGSAKSGTEAAGRTLGGGGGGGGGTVRNRELSSSFSSSSAALLEHTWRASWGAARGREGAGVLAETVPWTGSPASRANGGSGGGGGTGRRSLSAADGREDAAASGGRSGGGRIGSFSRAREFHGLKVAGYRAALQHLGERMENAGQGEQGGATLAEACGWDTNLVFVHGRDDLVYLRGIHHEEHDDATSAACFIGLVGFLSAQPEVMHIHPDAGVEANNKVLTAYIEGGEPTDTPMRAAGLTGVGEIIGVSDTGLDDSSCFFKDEAGLVPRTSMSAAVSYPDRRKVVQYVAFADDKDADGHGTHVAGIAAGKVYDDWQPAWEEQVSEAACEGAGLLRSCFGDCVEDMVGESCHWNPELSCPSSACDDDTTCDDSTGYDFPCFEEPVDEIPEASGVAPDAKLAFFDIGNADESLEIPEDIGDMWDAQHAAGARVMSNSWSVVMMTEPTARDVQLDEWVHDHQDSLVVFGAGNTGFQDGSFNPGSVQSPATGKTAMTVGASNSGPGRAYAYFSEANSEYDGVLWPDDDTMFKVSPFSARGPVGRFTAKPDVIAPGLMVHSAKASRSLDEEETCALDSMGGTSMSAPAVAGAAALVRQFFKQGVLASYLDTSGVCGGGGGNGTATGESGGGGVYARAGLCKAFSPSGYLVKAVLINSAMWLGDMQTVSYEGKEQFMSVLDFAQGFGAVQLAASVPTPEAPIGAFYHEHELASDSLYYYSVYVSDPDADLSVTVAWFDPPSTVSSYNLLHDLDIFVMSVDTQHYFRSNHYDTIVALCGDDESCAQKYEFTFSSSLADFMNPVERVVVPSSDLKEGYYVIGVSARILTESDTQAYGLAAAGGGLVVQDMSSSGSDFGLVTQSVGGGAAGDVSKPNPDGESADGGTPAPTVVESTAAPASAVLSPPEREVVATFSPAPSVEGEPATGGSGGGGGKTTPPVGDESKESTVSSGGVGDVESALSESSSSLDSVGVSYIGGGDSTGDDAAAYTTIPEVATDGGGFSSTSKIAIATSAAGAALLICVGACFAVRRNKVRSSATRLDETGSFLNPPRDAARSSRVATVSGVEDTPDINDTLRRTGDGRGMGCCGNNSQGKEEEEVEEVGLYEMSPLESDSSAMQLPSYASAVASMPEDEGHTMVRDPAGVEHTVELTAADESEISGFYAAVDSGALETLVSWGISRDFARVALRQTDNDIQDALRLIAEGNMDTLLAMDHEMMAREGEEAVRLQREREAAAGVAAATYRGTNV